MNKDIEKYATQTEYSIIDELKKQDFNFDSLSKDNITTQKAIQALLTATRKNPKRMMKEVERILASSEKSQEND